ncbi:SDR family oxidoreductase [Candidatus Nitrosotalea okcheonensis]|uniref:Putative dTDP-4-dehydrorhamnose reductase n=1 Tax=Candidatus Nitrosotalea okcheonensis TaxID=1903276 RepID=A0A2H1FHT6_9ARCH|nr:SDR family oxidoreductase [Candidatus Nitrosotalea okcheonensis]SMH72294.1 putative dTDP-4-dehydrorhamnose reductase [Candidatus Nitrosotalea okcheonensis]
MKIFVTGASGFLGYVITKKKTIHDIVGSYYSHEMLKMIHLDVLDKSKIEKIFQKEKPDVIIHAAAMRNDAVEKNNEMGRLINVKGTLNIVEICKKMGIMLVYISTDLIFDGKKGLYEENDIPNPLSYYGLTKFEAEKTVINNYDKTCVVRTSLLYGWNNSFSNFVMLVIQNLRKGQRFNAINDQYVSPSYAENVADMLIEICEKQITGICHVAGTTRLTRFEFANQISDIFELNKELIEPISMTEMNWKTNRGMDCSLSVELVKKILKTKPMSTLEGLKNMKNQERTHDKKE